MITNKKYSYHIIKFRIHNVYEHNTRTYNIYITFIQNNIDNL